MGGAQPRAASRAWRAPDLPRSEHRGRLTASRVLGLALALLALFETIAVAVHFEDMDVVGQPIEQRAGQPLGAEPRNEPEHRAPRLSSPGPCRLPTRASRRRSFTPAQPDCPAASVRDFLSGAYTSAHIYNGSIEMRNLSRRLGK